MARPWPFGTSLISTMTGRYLLKPRSIAELAPKTLAYVNENYKPHAFYLRHLASQPPWKRVDCDARLEDEAAGYRHTLQAEQALLAVLRDDPETQVVVDGGQHWLHRGLIEAVIARLSGDDPSAEPLVVDSDSEEYGGDSASNGRKGGQQSEKKIANLLEHKISSLLGEWRTIFAVRLSSATASLTQVAISVE